MEDPIRYIGTTVSAAEHAAFREWLNEHSDEVVSIAVTPASVTVHGHGSPGSFTVMRLSGRTIAGDLDEALDSMRQHHRR